MMGAAGRKAGAAAASRLLMRVLVSGPGRAVSGATVLLRYTSLRGRTVTLPVRAARGGDSLAVLVGGADEKRWWRHFRSAAPAQVWLDGAWHPAVGRVTAPDSATGAIYQRRFPRTALSASSVLVEFTCSGLRSTPMLLRGTALVRRWFVVVTIGEFIGFSVPACAGALTAGATPAVTVGAVLLAGAAEGTVLGFAQAMVLRRALIGFDVRRWVAATAGAAVIAYAIGMLPSTAGARLTAVPPVLLIAGAVVLGSALLLSIGTAQWLVLRTVVRRPTSWIATTAIAWSAGLAVFLAFAMPLWQPGQPPGVIVAIGVAGGLLMAAVTAAITGNGLRRLLRRAGPDTAR